MGLICFNFPSRIFFDKNISLTSSYGNRWCPFLIKLPATEKPPEDLPRASILFSTSWCGVQTPQTLTLWPLLERPGRLYRHVCTLYSNPWEFHVSIETTIDLRTPRHPADPFVTIERIYDLSFNSGINYILHRLQFLIEYIWRQRPKICPFLHLPFPNPIVRYSTTIYVLFAYHPILHTTTPIDCMVGFLQNDGLGLISIV